MKSSDMKKADRKLIRLLLDDSLSILSGIMVMFDGYWENPCLRPLYSLGPWEDSRHHVPI
jgi:hypothetical protein